MEEIIKYFASIGLPLEHFPAEEEGFRECWQHDGDMYGGGTGVYVTIYKYTSVYGRRIYDEDGFLAGMPRSAVAEIDRGGEPGMSADGPIEGWVQELRSEIEAFTGNSSAAPAIPPCNGLPPCNDARCPDCVQQPADYC